MTNSDPLYRYPPAIADRLGAETIRTMHREKPQYNCAGCKENGDPSTDNTSVIVITAPQQVDVVQFAHSRCLPSQIVVADHIDYPTGSDDGDDVTSTTTVLPAGPGRPQAEAMLIIDRDIPFELVIINGDTVNLWLNDLLEHGWALAAPTFVEIPVAAQYSAHIDSDGTGYVSSPHNTPLLDHIPPPVDGWLETARAAAGLTVLAGRIGLDNAHPGVTGAAITRAIAQGNVAVARIPVIFND
ncbi:hypothetical protein IUS39_23760 [Mycobacteroides abscessus subsp. massiliense]|uniref:hypothetical protein n=1 Tax=Mycobacteroides abscessus TaxID=36809 RepID=UPI0009290485|nr:hypothetical protein [Mycobacteroides abscessus]MBN7428695.1 hypothetical protein [Mycobacteroides abscessus subsp. massiliense]SIN48037.1 Uncharacterised protein [Mycobacteroides abscessus subsp. bolletii]